MGSVQPPPERLNFSIDSDGWTVLSRGGIEQRSYHVGIHKANEPEGTTLNEVIKTYDSYVDLWKATDSCAEMITLFEQTLLTLKDLRVNACFCLGLGTLTAPHPYCSPTPEGSLYQLAAFETMVEVLRRKFKIEHVHVQDPVMNSLDKGLLSSRGITVLKHPEAMNLVSSSSFVYAPNLEWAVTQDLLEAASPSVYIGNDLMRYLDFVHYPEGVPEEHRRERMERDREENAVYKGYAAERQCRKIPNLESHDVTLGQVMFWRE